VNFLISLVILSFSHLSFLLAILFRNLIDYLQPCTEYDAVRYSRETINLLSVLYFCYYLKIAKPAETHIKEISTQILENALLLGSLFEYNLYKMYYRNRMCGIKTVAKNNAQLLLKFVAEGRK
jgi:hypothetical protein